MAEQGRLERVHILIHPYGPRSGSGLLGSIEIGAKCSWQYDLLCSRLSTSQNNCGDKLSLYGFRGSL